MTPKLNAAERMLRSKKKLIIRLKSDIAKAQQAADYEIERIQGRIRIAQALADALEKGTLKP
jgi:hypothetical protein